MKTTVELCGTVAPSRQSRILSLIVAMATFITLLSPTAFALAPQTAQNYPLLPDLPGADIRGEAGVVVHLVQGRALVEVDTELYALGDRPLEIGFDGLTQVTVLFELPDERSNTLFLTEDGQWTETVTARLGTFDYILLPGDPSVGLEIAGPDQEAPTRPDIILVPIEDDPEPD